MGGWKERGGGESVLEGVGVVVVIGVGERAEEGVQ
jgi:hypothetical protein